MNYLITTIVNRLTRLAGETRGQDLIEYALLASFLAVATAALIPNVASNLSTIFSEVTSVLVTAASQS